MHPCKMHSYTIEEEDKEMDEGLFMDMDVLFIWGRSHGLSDRRAGKTKSANLVANYVYTHVAEHKRANLILSILYNLNICSTLSS